jgi:ADP-ribosyl-[dinitrogen reductase] hydrolase
VGDAVGTTLEFKPRYGFEPITDMIGGGPFDLEPGEWTDDTSMALCLGTSLRERGGFDPIDQMDRYCNWRDHGYLSSTGECFDIGMTVAEALRRYEATGDPFSGSVDPYSAGNGSIMRLAPIALFYFPNREAIIEHAVESSRTTHGAPECLDACRILGELLFRALAGAPRHEILLPVRCDDCSDALRAVSDLSVLAREASEVRGSGYVVDSLGAALWCFARSESYADAVLMAANLGDDADTTAAVCGQVAGAYYGESAIPAHWLARLAWRDQIGELARDLHWFTRSLLKTESTTSK